MNILIAAALAAHPAAVPQAPPSAPPKLAVILVVDQMRADYVDRFKGGWTGGLKRMVDEGAWFTNTAYPYLTTVTCAGHATISTGSFPRTHGIFQNAWWDRDAQKQMFCNEDPRVTDVPYSAGATLRQQRLPAAGADLHRRDAHRAQGARRLARAQGPQRHHARRPRRRRGDLAQQHHGRLDHVARLQRDAGAGRQGVPRRQPDRRRLRQDLEPGTAARRSRGRTMAWARRRRRDGRARFRTC